MNKYQGLNEMQQKAVLQTEGPVLILAGAGSGKTRVLTHRISYLVEQMHVPSYHILAITFTNKAAKEMRERAYQLVGEAVQDAWISTFHSACIRILKMNAERIGYSKRFTIYDPDDQKAVIKRILKEMNLSDKMFTPKAILGEISRSKDEMVTPKMYQERVGYSDLFRKKVALIYEQYQQNLLDNQAMDFDDIINKTVELFSNNPDVLNYYQDKFRYIMVDEYQDTNTAQYLLVKLLSSKYRNLCVVGDDDQSIYRFRGANIRNILDYEKDFPDALVIRLEQNYRSTSNILNAANHVIRNNSQRKEKTLWTENPEGEKIIVHSTNTENEEAAYVVSTIQDMVDKGECSYKDIAMLYRTNAQSRALEEKLVVSAVPYRLFGGTPFYQRKEIKDLLCYLRLIANDRDYVAAERVINVPGRGIGNVTYERLRVFAAESGFGVTETCDMAYEHEDFKRSAKKLEDFSSMIGKLREMVDQEAIEKLIHQIIEVTGYSSYLLKDDPVKYEDRMQNIEELINRADQYEKENEEPTLDGFLDELSLVAAIDEFKEGDDTVVLMTLHSAKGLEFPVVFMTGMEDGIFPSYMSISSGDEEDIEEERRLCYVGITRAKKKLFMTWSAARRVNGMMQQQTKSRFLKELPSPILTIEEEDTMSWADDIPSFAGRTTLADRYIREAKQKELRERTMNSSRTDAYGKSSEGAGTMPNEQPEEGFKVGDAVKHRAFGLGTVTEVKWVNADYQVRVNFAKVGEKLLFAKLARLKKV